MSWAMTMGSGQDFFSHQKVAFVGVPLHASNLPAMES
jgi:hypothetical protein